MNKVCLEKSFLEKILKTINRLSDSCILKIEDNEIDQHEGAFIVGKLLKEIYIDSALKKSEKLDKHQKKINPAKKGKKISYSDFKNMVNQNKID